METILRIKDLSIAVKDRALVKNVSFDVDEGDVVLISGQNGMDSARALSITAGKLPVAGLRRQGADCFQSGNNCDLRRRWQQHSQVLWHCLEAAAAAASASQSARLPKR